MEYISASRARSPGGNLWEKVYSSMVERLRQRDIEASLHYLRELYAQQDLDGFKQHVLTTISDLVPSEFTTYNELDLRTSKNVWRWEPTPSGFAELTEIFALYMGENPCVAYYRRTGDGRATKISDFLTHRELRKLGYYNEYEAEILLGIARGESNKEIAASLYVSPLTVKTHLQRVYRKLGVRGRTEALALALQHLDALD